MGTIVSPANGSDVVKGQVIPVIYRSDTVDFSCGALSDICTIDYKIDGAVVAGSVPISQTGAAPQTQAAQNLTMPSTGTTVQIDVEGWGVGGQLHDAATVTYNLIDAPVAAPTVTCGAGTPTTTTVQLQGNIQGILPAGGSVRFSYGTNLNGPYPNTIAAAPYAVGGVNANLTGLNPNTAYHFICEVLDSTGVVVAASTDCSFTTDAVTNTTEPIPNYANLVKNCSITGVTPVCDTSGTPYLLVTVTSADGDVLPLTSTEFPALPNSGIFSAIGYFRSYIANLNGTLANPQPTLGKCGATGQVDVIQNCSDVAKSEIAYGPNLLTNGDFALSTGVGLTSNPAVGWTTGYAPSANIFASGAGTYAFFTTNAGAVTGGNATASLIAALTTKSMAVNVGPNLAQPILSWANIYLENGASYALEADCAIISNPFGLAIQVDGIVVTPMTAPGVTGKWEHTSSVFTWTGASGYHLVTVNSNSGVAAGNDHCLDNFTLRKAFAGQIETLTSKTYSETVKAVVDQIVEMVGCNDDRRDKLLAEISSLLTKAQSSDQIEVICACDDADGDGVGEVSYKRVVSISTTGAVTTLANYNQQMTAVYTPVGPVPCDVAGDSLVRVIPQYKVLSGAGTWTLNTDSAAPTIAVSFATVKVGNLANPPTVRTAAGTFPLYIGSVNWSSVYGRDVAGLKPPLVLTTHVNDIVAVTWTEESV